jgi:hypothetical protein
MGSIVQTSLSSSVLERTHILEEILRHVDQYSQTFDKVDYEVLKEEVLKPVLAESFDPEIQIRGFLKTFRHTVAYKSALSKIASQELKDQINDFIEGKQAKEVVDNKGFNLASHSRASPPVVHHFSLLERLKKLIVGGLESRAAIKNILHPQHKHVKNLPIIFADAGNTNIIEVSHFPALVDTLLN